MVVIAVSGLIFAVACSPLPPKEFMPIMVRGLAFGTETLSPVRPADLLKDTENLLGQIGVANAQKIMRLSFVATVPGGFAEKRTRLAITLSNGMTLFLNKEGEAKFGGVCWRLQPDSYFEIRTLIDSLIP